MSELIFYSKHNEEISVSVSQIIEDLLEEGYVVLSDKLDYTDQKMLIEIVDKFLVSDFVSREKIHKTVTKDNKPEIEEVLSNFNNYDIFNYLDYQSFDFLDNIDSQEIIRHLEDVGYKVIEK